ncbi:DUF3606 domain-containing protein [Methylobacterium persicinum]|uniref:DUF3606 domain-containing protein n=1 Tax=Methylobacterium persicinum TaxID=374426 RepID=A0ABU0HF91_9HYPH|nr:DUF3606 domain-containing protein [Methylobacterium persicinum]MDQ0440970.1 hypothetical protein [Methylobacterium persicinum]GJE39977.1 hypothetical protein KHHGKMAE_4066 [Methylobacterium persicinum]
MAMGTEGKSHIDIVERTSRLGWAKHFNVTEERLRKAVSMVGTRVTSVAAFLHRPGS